jgi:hypothetical protein
MSRQGWASPRRWGSIRPTTVDWWTTGRFPSDTGRMSLLRRGPTAEHGSDAATPRASTVTEQFRGALCGDDLDQPRHCRAATGRGVEARENYTDRVIRQACTSLRGIGLAVVAVALAGCESVTNVNGCANFHPRSAPLAVGESTPVTVVVSQDRTVTDSLDVNGGYYEFPRPSPWPSPNLDTRPRVSSSPGTYTARVRRDQGGLWLELPSDNVQLVGPLGCQ